MADPRDYLATQSERIALVQESGASQDDQWAAMRDDRKLFFGTDGDVEFQYLANDTANSTTPNELEANCKGSSMTVTSMNLGRSIVLSHYFGGKLPSINASIAFTTDQDFEVLGTNASADDVTNDPEGGVICETDGANNDSVILAPHLDANQTQWTTVTWGTDQRTRWECSIKLGTTAQSITGTTIWAGLKLTNVDTLSTDDNQAFFRYGAAAGTSWHAISSISTADTDTDTGVVLAQNTVYRLVIQIDGSRIARFYINNALVATTDPLTTAIDLIPYIGVKTESGATARRITARHTGISRLYA